MTDFRAHVVEVADRVYAYVQHDGSWWINNTAFLVDAGGDVISVDSCSTVDRTRRYLDAIADRATGRVHMLVNTHHHGDHTYGNYLFDGAAVVAHRATRDAQRAWGLPGEGAVDVWTPVDWGPLELRTPTLTFDDEVTLWVDDAAVTVRHVGQPAHTDNDSIVWLPRDRVLIAGDLAFHGGTPFLLQGSVQGAIDVIEQVVLPLAPATVIPGHGAVCGPEVFDDTLAYLRFVLEVAREAVASGVDPLTAALETDLGGYAQLLDAERIVGNLHRACAELRGTSVDAHGALADMVTYNGGRPLHSMA